ncbi:threonine/homoserine/homoserine lactone efflux protein [Catenulispora sp. GP43]|uniref:LysE family translocator n=1 Tax=Catenulispora sp. GP43 TaxID=3156263 RepID=UPI003513DEA2
MTGSVFHALLSFALVAGLITIIPGLDTAVVLRSALVLGRRQAFATAFGINVGALVWGAAAATGVSMLLTASHDAYTALRVVGAVYLLWMGFGMLRAARRGELHDAVVRVPDAGLGRAFLRGAWTNLLNPKVGAFYIAIFPQFMPAHVSHLAMGLMLAGAHDLEAMVWFTVLILGAHRARGWFAKRRVKRAMDAVTGAVLVGFGVELALRG